MNIIKAAKNTVDISLKFHSDLIQSIGTFLMLKKFLRNSLRNRNDKQYIIYLILYFLRLRVKKVEIKIFVLDDFSLSFHKLAESKLTNNGTRIQTKLDF
jgi:hypothetical protein